MFAEAVHAGQVIGDDFDGAQRLRAAGSTSAQQFEGSHRPELELCGAGQLVE